MERDPKGAPKKLASGWRPDQEEVDVGKSFMHDGCSQLSDCHFLNCVLCIWEEGAREALC